MKILGVSLGQLTTAAVMVDGRIVACVSEERFTRHKNDMEFPVRSIEHCMREAGIAPGGLDVVAIASTHIPADYQLTKKFSHFSIADQIREQHEFWKPKLLEGGQPRWLEVFRDKIDRAQYPGDWSRIDVRDEETMWRTYKAHLHQLLARVTGTPLDRIVHVDHHTGHAAYAYYASPFRGEDCLVFTVDAYGDGLSATISTVNSDKLTRIAESSSFYLGRLYRYVTLILGMKPNEHEYKVMGLAPYAKPDILRGPYAVFKQTMFVDGLDFKFHEKPADLYFHFRDRLEGFRFDGIAGGLQKYLEEILCEWVANAVAKTNIRKVVWSGGVALNIKALKVVASLPEVDDLFNPPSGGDESLAIGVCYQVAANQASAAGKPPVLQPLSDAYLGPSYSDGEAAAALAAQGCAYDIEKDVTPRRVAQLLADGWVLARCSGRAEFGARALGNRSILADPRDASVIAKINEKIKNRDFWMPFTPSMLEERASDYIVNPKGLRAPFMTVAFDSTALAHRDIPAALHPADHTARPQIVTKTSNPGYYAILKEFEAITGVGAVLNTSFNLHGQPIVNTPVDAFHVFDESDLDALVFDHLLVKKRRGGSSGRD